MKYKTRYSNIVPKGQIGECMDKVDGELLALLIKFDNGEVFWFMKRDLIEVKEYADEEGRNSDECTKFN